MQDLIKQVGCNVQAGSTLAGGGLERLGNDVWKETSRYRTPSHISLCNLQYLHSLSLFRSFPFPPNR